MAPHSSTLAWKIPRMEEPGRLQSKGVTKGRTRLSDFTFTFHFHALEKEIATHSSVLAWRIPGTGEPGGLPSMGSHRVGHDWSDLAAAAANQFRTSLVVQTVKHLPTMWETRVQSLGWEDLLEKETATHSNILAWKIPWEEEPGRPQSMGLQRVGHDWATSLSLSNQFYQEVSSKSSFPLSTFGFPGISVGKESICKAGDLGSIPGSGRSPGEGNGNPQRSLVGYSSWVRKESDTTELLNHQTLLAFGFFLPSYYSEFTDYPSISIHRSLWFTNKEPVYTSSSKY